MSFFVIGESDTVLGFSLAGVSGRVAITEVQMRTAFKAAVAASENKILIIDEKSASLIRETIEAHTASNDTPLILEIPGVSGVSGDRIKIDELIRKAIGINV